MLLVRPRVLFAAAVTLAAAGGLATWTQKAPAPPAVAAHALTSIGPAPEGDGSPLTEACSRRVGCLLR